MKTVNDYEQDLPGYVQDATNIYRTKHYIVKQVLSMRFDKDSYNTLVSVDTFYLRTKERDAEFEYFFDFLKNPDGKRIKTAMSTRTYID